MADERNWANANPPLATERLVLEPLLAAHAAALLPGLRDPVLYRFIPTDPPASLAALEARYRRLESRASPDGSERWLNWAMRRADGAYVGTLEATVMPGAVAHVAYLVFREHQCQGYAAEGCRAVIAHLIGLGVRTVVAEIDTRNAASIALVERLGFVCVSTTPNADHFKGAPSDEHRYELRITAPTAGVH
jgi:[ribosomal protein S5]-alanine N-acetyltransferase